MINLKIHSYLIKKKIYIYKYCYEKHFSMCETIFTHPFILNIPIFDKKYLSNKLNM